jgi:hypothetical protein
MSEDFGAAVVDAASADVSTPVTTNDSAVVDTPTTSDTDLSVVTADTENAEESTEVKETLTRKADGSERTPEEQEDFRAKAAGKEPLPAEVRTALKALKEMDPKNANIVKQLHGAYERYTAIKEALGNEGPNGLKSFLSELGSKNIGEARAALAQQNTMLEAVRSSDEALYAADPILSENVYEDMKAQGKEDAYGKVVGNFLDHLKEVDSNAYYEVQKGHVIANLEAAGFTGTVNSIWHALAENDTNKAKALCKNLGTWFSELRSEVSADGKLQRALSEREQKIAAKEAEGVKAARTATENSVAEDCERSSNVELGKFLGSFLRLPFFKDWSRETKIDLGNGIKEKLYRDLKADSRYQSSMKSLWSAKTVDRAKMVQVHTNWLQQHGDALVRGVVQTRYPGYARGGSAAGKKEAMAANKTAATKAGAQSVATGKPIFVASKPTNLIREAVKIGGREYSRNDLDVMLITGKGFVRTTDGKSVRLVSWRKA